MDFNNSSGLRSPFSPRVRQSISGRRPLGLPTTKSHSKFMQASAASSGDVIYKTPSSTVETFGLPLPVQVTEGLTFGSGSVSVRLSPCGWCWIVFGRRVVAWPREPGSARELTLPQTDLAHKADLVALYYEDGAQMPSCVGVSPEGVVRYWPSVAQEDAYVDVSAELAGQECDRLVERTDGGRTDERTDRDRLVLATTTCTLVLLNPAVIDGVAGVSCCAVRYGAGWLGGIGRRVSLLFFGNAQHQHLDTKLVGVVSLEGSGGRTESEGGGGAVCLVSRGPALQVWRGAALHEHALRRPLLDALANHHLAHTGELNTLELVALEVRAGGPGSVLLLVGVVSVARPPDVRYALAEISVEDPASPRVTSVVGVRGWTREEPDESPRFLPLGSRLLLYTSKHLVLVNRSTPHESMEVVDVSAERDRVLSAELCGAAPLVFTRNHGVLTVRTHADSLLTTPSGCSSPLGSPSPSDAYDGNLSLYEIDPHEMRSVCSDACGKLKTAFLFHVRRETGPCRALLADLFPPGPAAPAAAHSADADVDAPLDRTVLAVATEMLDDMPAGDPRWTPRCGPATRIALGASAALQPAAQLHDKQRAFELYVHFLRATGLWQRLSLVTSESSEGGSGCRSTVSALAALAERLAGARALLALREGPHAPLIDAAVHQVVCGEQAGYEEDPEVEAALSSGALTAGDVCFRRASRAAPRVLVALARARPPPAPTDAARHAADTMHVITCVLSEMARCRAAWSSEGVAGAAPRSLGPALVALVSRSLTEQYHNCSEAGLRGQLVEGAAALADLLLSAAAHLQRDPRTQHLYEKTRRDLILPFLHEGERERAAALAGKFRDFDLLIELCVSGDELDRLYQYIDKYIEQGMAEHTFAWLMDRGGRERALLVRSVGARYGTRLASWLRAVPARRDLCALHRLCEGRHGDAAALLADIAQDETDSVNRMTTAASLAKLCLVAAEESDSLTAECWRRVEARLQLGEQHGALPRDIRLHHGLDAPDSRVFSPEDLVQMYVESESRSLTEFDYKKALDLTEFVEDMERRDELRLEVWCASVVRDDWETCRVDAPADALRDCTFFRLMDLVHVMGGDLALVLPPLEDVVTAPRLASLVSDPRVRYLLQYGYQCLHPDTHTTS